MRVAVKSRFTNIHGGYEEKSSLGSRPAFRRCGGGAWIFHHEARWHFSPELPDIARGGRAAVIATYRMSFTNCTDGGVQTLLHNYFSGVIGYALEDDTLLPGGHHSPRG